MTEQAPVVTKQKLAAGFGWVALFNYTNRLLGILSTLILAKLLTPADFGLVAIAMMLLDIVQLVKDMGLSEAVIFSKREDRQALDTAHTVLFGYNALLFITATVAAPFVAAYYGNPRITMVVVVMSSTLVVNSLRIVPYSLIRKSLDYRALVIPEIVPSLVSSLVSIGMALSGFGVWSMVAKAVINSLMSMVLLSMVSTYKPRFGFDGVAARELLHYGKFIAGTSVLLVALYNIDRFYISSAAGIAALGTYELAMRIAELPIRQFSFLVGAVMFPVFSRMNQSSTELQRLSLQTLKYSAAVTLPAAIGISVFGPLLMRLMYGDRWLGIELPLRIVALYAGMRSLSSVIYDLFKATGNPQLMQGVTLFKLATIAVLGGPAVRGYGIVGIAVVVVATYFVALAWEVVALSKVIGAAPGAIVRVIATPLAISVPATITVYVLFTHVGNAASLWQTIAAMVVVSATYAGLFYQIDPDVANDLRRMRGGEGKPSATPATDLPH